MRTLNKGFKFPQAHDSIVAPRVFGVVKDNTTMSVSYIGIKGQVIRAFNANLAARSQGSTLETWEYDLIAAKELDNARKKMDVKSSTAYKKYSDLHWAFRSTVKDTVVSAMRRKEVGKGGLMLAIPHLDKLHTCIGQVRAKLSDLVYGAEPAVPFWECYTLVGHNDAKEPLFEKSEIWDAEEFTEYCGTTKFLRDAVKWAVSAALQDETAPCLEHSDGEIFNRFYEGLARGIKSRVEQDALDGKAVWNRMDFYQGGAISSFKDDIHVETCLAMVGRVVKSYNNIVNSMSYEIGQMLNREVKAGLESADSTRNILGHEITVAYDMSGNEVYVAEDAAYKAFTLELDELTQRVERFMAAWERVLPRKYLISLGTDFNGGYRFNDVDADHQAMLEAESRLNNKKLVARGKKPVVFKMPEQFSKLPYELADISAYFDKDMFAEQKAKRRAYALEAEAARLAELKANASPIIIK